MENDLAAIVDDWFNATLARPPISTNTEAYNQAFAAKEVLKVRLAALSKPAPIVEPAHEPAEPVHATTQE